MGADGWEEEECCYVGMLSLSARCLLGGFVLRDCVSARLPISIHAQVRQGLCDKLDSKLPLQQGFAAL